MLKSLGNPSWQVVLWRPCRSAEATFVLFTAFCTKVRHIPTSMLFNSTGINDGGFNFKVLSIGR